ncbi:nectin-4-like [Hyposmocoma kahamanoa]|uniref:nectin-4-like n=1 Tax=Hyposmocoma kahamanoa TaxID=1477025 RepID=UPI000E6D7EC2|nr:nectin-4-like [Hyposmocoma kahamanoa]XP_026314731.1 nectin-4-like [Hyposmocoma kahamanoa]XP_026314732.1 nectin-4-like [Hyposmocoma kahamanoa]
MMGASNGVKAALCISLLPDFLFLIAGSGTEATVDDTTMDISSRRFRAEFLQEWQGSYDSPYFDMTTPRNVTGLVGHPVKLLCRVKNLQNRTVSWVRHRDIHLLTVGRYTYTSDQRFEAQHKPRSEEWELRIRSPQRRDSGQYECQISTTPPIGMPVYLNIVAPETIISSGPELFIQAGSTINLTCTVKHTPEPPTSITWTFGEQVINFDSARGGISLVTEKGIVSKSRLLVQRATGNDAGLYTCGPNNAPPGTTRVHVLSGEHPAAMQQGCARLSLDKAASILLIGLYIISISFNNLLGT